MKILAIETTAIEGSIALMDDKHLIAEYRLNVPTRHAERIMVSIDHLLKQSLTNLNDLDAIAVSIGPGSFTGLRVGLATAKGLAVGANLPLVLVPTLEAMASGFPYAHPLIAPFIDAHKGEVYTALFDAKNEQLHRLQEDQAIPPQAALEKIRMVCDEMKRPVLFTGDGAIKYQNLIQKKMGEQACFPPPAFQFSSAAQVAKLAFGRFLKGEMTPPDLANPVYLRASTAELKKKEAEIEPESDN